MELDYDYSINNHYSSSINTVVTKTYVPRG